MSCSRRGSTMVRSVSHFYETAVIGEPVPPGADLGENLRTEIRMRRLYLFYFLFVDRSFESSSRSSASISMSSDFVGAADHDDARIGQLDVPVNDAPIVRQDQAMQSCRAAVREPQQKRQRALRIRRNPSVIGPGGTDQSGDRACGESHRFPGSSNSPSAGITAMSV